MALLSEYLNVVASFGNTAFYEPLVLTHGKLYTDRLPTKPNERYTKRHECFKNAYHTAHDNGWEYCEG